MSTSKKTMLLTGAAGFVGSSLTKYFYPLYNLILLDDLSYGDLNNLKFDYLGTKLDLGHLIIECDITDKEKLSNELLKFDIDIIIHCAAIAPLADCQANPSRAMDVNVNGWINILEISRQIGVEKVLLASTNAVYENEKSNPTKIKNIPTLIYPLTKYFAESVSNSYIDTYGMNISIMRFSNVYGPNMDINREYPPFIAYIIKELNSNQRPVIYNNGSSKRSYIYTKDLCELVENIISDNTNRVIDICGEEHYTPMEIFDLISELMNIEIEPIIGNSLNYWDAFKHLSSGQYPISNDLIKKEINKNTKCNHNGVSYYNWRQKYSFRKGLVETIEEYKKLMQSKPINS